MKQSSSDQPTKNNLSRILKLLSQLKALIKPDTEQIQRVNEVEKIITGGYTRALQT